MLPETGDKSRFVERMFDRIAPRYDLLNRVMTLGADRAWRRVAVERAGVGPGRRVLDLGCGTADLCVESMRWGAGAVGVDPSRNMLGRAQLRAPRAEFVRAVGESLPFEAASFDAVLSGFAVRNFTSLERVLSECARVLVDGGRIVLLEVDVPRSALLRLGFRVYLGRIVPLVGSLLSERGAYSYLGRSLAYLPDEQALAGLLEASGFEDVEKLRIAGGGIQIVCARRRARD